MNRSLHALLWIAIIGLVGGAAALIISAATWPQWSIADQMQTAQNMATILGTDITDIDPSTLTQPTPTGHIIAVALGSIGFVYGALAGLFALHAAAVRSRVVA